MEQAQQSFDISRYIGIIRRRKWWAIIPILVLVPLAIVAAAKFAPPKYQAQAMLFIGSSKAEQQVDIALRLDAERVAKRKLADVSNRMLDYNTVRQLFVGDQVIPGLLRDPQTGEQLVDVNDPIELEQAIEELRDEVKLELQGSEYVNVSYSNTNSSTAQRVVSTLINSFLNDWIGQVKDEYGDILTQHQNNIQKIVEQSNTADERLREFRESLTRPIGNGPSGIVLLSDDPALLVRQQADIQERLHEIEYEIPAKEERIGFLEKELMNLTESKETAVEKEPSIMSQKIREAIADLEINRLMLQDEFTDDHPRIKKIDNQIALLKAREADTEEEVVRRTIKEDPLYYEYRKESKELELEVNMLRKERESLQQFSQQIQQNINQFPQLKEQESLFERQSKALDRQYEQALEARAQAEQRLQLAQEARMDAFELVSVARSSQQPDYMDSLKVIGLGIFVAGFFAVAAVVGREVLDQSFTTVDEARDFLRLPSLGYVPVIVTRRDRRRKWLLRIALLAVAALVIGGFVYGYLAVPAIKEQIDDVAVQLYGILRQVLPI